MDKETIWKLFKQTGNIEAYLLYKNLVKQELANELTGKPGNDNTGKERK